MDERTWQEIEEEIKRDLATIKTDQDAYAFMDKYMSRDLKHDYLKIYRSDRHEMGRTPQQALQNILSLPAIQ